MIDQAGFIKEYKAYFLLDETKFRKIANVIHDFAVRLNKNNYVKYYVEREDDTFYETTDIEEVLKDENSEKKTITTLVITIVCEDKAETDDKKTEKKSLVTVGFKKTQMPSITFGVKGENREWGLLLTDELDTQIKRVIVSRSTFLKRMQRIADVLVFALIIPILAALLQWYTQLQKSVISGDDIATMTTETKINTILSLLVQRENLSPWVILSMTLVIPLFLVFLEVKPISWIISKSMRSTFYWGDMINVYNKSEKIKGILKWTIITGFAIGLISSIVATWLMRK